LDVDHCPVNFVQNLDRRLIQNLAFFGQFPLVFAATKKFDDLKKIS
jgi:hypothetical protein